jgi:PAS domain S-box-containing protein
MSAEAIGPVLALTMPIEVLERIEEGFCALDGELNITYVNASAERIWQRQREDLIGRRAEDVLPGLNDDAVRRGLAAALSDSGRRIAHAFGPTGNRIDIHIHANPAGLWLYLRDVSVRCSLEQQLRERDDLLTLAERSAGIGIWDVDLPTETVRGTPQFWRVMGLPPTDQAVPMEITRQLRLPEDREQVSRGFRAVVANHADSFEMEYRIRRPDGEIRWIFGRGRLIRDAAGHPLRYSGIDIDVTERKAAEAALAVLNEHLENRVRERTAELEAEIERRAEAEARLHQAQKMETIGQLTGGIAHDFNNLLTVISGNIEALERQLPADDLRLRRYAEAAIRSTERAATLTHRLLAFARRQPLEPRLLDVNQLLQGMHELLRRTLGESVALRMRLADDLRAVYVDPNQLESAILNLAVNSRDAMPQGGMLTIESAYSSIGESDPAMLKEAGTGYVTIVVRDTGMGMTAEIRDKAFEPFFTTKELGQGTGLGLPQVYGFIKQSGGHCRLDSEYGKGTTVRLYLPSAGQHDIPLDKSDGRQTGLVRGRGEMILVTEDDPDVREYSAELLRELGYEVLTASDAAMALRVLEENPAIGLLFTDLGLPGLLNGRQLAETALSHYPDLRILLTTGYASDAVLRKGWADTAMELITKPFTSAALAAKIRRAFQL